MQLTLITHEVENTLICQRASDGYVNATAMCNAWGKLFPDYLLLDSTSEFLTELSIARGIASHKLMFAVNDGDPSVQGTWVHPDVAPNLAMWCSPKFAVAVSQWIFEWMSRKTRPSGLPVHLERYMTNVNFVPTGYFSMLSEITLTLVAPLEKLGYTLPEQFTPDISTGKMFCKFLRDELGLDTDALPSYEHHYPDGRVVLAKLYPDRILAEFRAYFNNVWLPQRAMGYFAKRDPIAVKYLPEIVRPGYKSVNQ
jgi:hypothetical protein